MKSKQRVADHGKVFTPSWMVANCMLDAVAEAWAVDHILAKQVFGIAITP